MDTSLWIAVIVIAVGTYAMRLIPLLWMQRHLQKHEDKDALNAVPQWLSILGPLMIAAMLGVSMTPKTNDAAAWAATLIGCAATLLAWYCTRSLGLPVLVGVVMFGVSSLLL